MRPKMLLFVCVALLNVLFATHGTMADLDGLINIDDPAPTSQGSENSKRVDGSGGEGDDEDDYGSVMGDESGSGSGDEETTDPSIVDVSVVSPTTEESPTTTEAETTTEIDNEITEEPTGDESEEVDEVDGESTDDNMYGGGVGATKPSGNDPSKDKNAAADDPSKDKSPNAEARVDKKVLRVLTTEVIAAVVVGAVCAVILIAFLVYRLRKRDEGSYALSDAGYKDTYKLQGDTGKEAFV